MKGWLFKSYDAALVTTIHENAFPNSTSSSITVKNLKNEHGMGAAMFRLVAMAYRFCVTSNDPYTVRMADLYELDYEMTQIVC